jgi:histone deacetylase complex regulatory component SIN3
LNSDAGRMSNGQHPPTEPVDRAHPPGMAASVGPFLSTGTSPTATSAVTSTASAVAAVDSNQQPRINIKDAIHYLDRVKADCSDKPDMYSKFLTIMKDYKSAS